MVSSERTYKQRLELTDFQSSFLESFLQENSTRCHIIVAPPGAGKTITGAKVAADLLDRNLEARVLVIAPGPLLGQWRNSLSQLVPEAPIHIIDRMAFRSLQVAKSEQTGFWPPGVSIMSVDIAKRHEIADQILVDPWRLVLLDEAHIASGESKTLLSKLHRSGSVERLLLMTATWNEALRNACPDSEVTDWTGAINNLMKAWLHQAGKQRRALFRYQRTPDEVLFLRRLTTFTDWVLESDDRPQGTLACKLLLHMASSSILAFAESWERLGIMRLDAASRTNHDQEATERSSRLAMSETHLEWLEALVSHGEQELDRLAMDVTQALQNVAGDGKLAALGKLLQQLGSEGAPRRVCILTSFKTTSGYLQYADLAQANEKCRVVTSFLDAQKREQEINAYLVEGGILVGTDAALSEYPLEGTDAVIHYDMPRSLAQMQARHSHFWSATAEDSPIEYAFRDESQTLALEGELLRLHRWNLSSLD